ncbi:hypothetical protein J2Z48_002562 [Croceifilum oryzae]|uniref:Uncharacterized protein n=1 Tax=Croceifilum oryzae TaxID=1553429 RepID=A0AAJ1TGD2_9BACL|nr:hypothetical protein [Croceifilum oryzae]
MNALGLQDEGPIQLRLYLFSKVKDGLWLT